MGIRHRIYPVFGIQFHPESVGSPLGSNLISSFISQKAVLVDAISAKTQVRRP
jgi:carbamoylphosphate synthase small subunit